MAENRRETTLSWTPGCSLQPLGLPGPPVPGHPPLTELMHVVNPTSLFFLVLHFLVYRPHPMSYFWLSAQKAISAVPRKPGGGRCRPTCLQSKHVLQPVELSLQLSSSAFLFSAAQAFSWGREKAAGPLPGSKFWAIFSISPHPLHSYQSYSSKLHLVPTTFFQEAFLSQVLPVLGDSLGSPSDRHLPNSHIWQEAVLNRWRPSRAQASDR